jgi:ABC-type sugar transport system ATPase subunit
MTGPGTTEPGARPGSTGPGSTGPGSTGPATTGPVCVLRGITKSFGATRALDGVDLDIRPGRIHAILGENGAGKSTLMKILAGAEKPDSGRIELAGQPVAFGTVRAANDAGIATVFQETLLFGTLDVIENLAGSGYPTSRGLIDRPRMERAARPILRQIGLDVPLRQPVSELTLAQRQLVEIAKALLVKSRVLILDEPNSALQQEESQRLFQVVRRLADDGVAVLYISHRLEEVFSLADTVTVLRNGRLIATVPAQESSIPEAIEMMLGRAAESLARSLPASAAPGDTVVSLAGVTAAPLVRDVDLTVRAGEIVGLAGLDDAGPRQVMRLLFGQLRPQAGQVRVLGADGAPRSPARAVRRGIAFVPSDRAEEGLALALPIVDNVVQVHVGAFSASPVIRRRQLRKLAARALAASGADPARMDAPAGDLSGGNQQKLVFAKWRAVAPKLVLLEDPGRGVDVGAKAEIFATVRELARRGAAVLFFSTEFQEYALICDRVSVFRGGTVVADLAASAATEHTLLALVNGQAAG